MDKLLETELKKQFKKEKDKNKPAAKEYPPVSKFVLEFIEKLEKDLLQKQ